MDRITGQYRKGQDGKRQGTRKGRVTERAIDRSRCLRRQMEKIGRERVESVV